MNGQKESNLSPNEGSNVESDIDELSDQMNTMQRRILRIEEERQDTDI